MSEETTTSETRPSALDRALRVFGDVRPGEGVGVLLMFLNIFVLLVAYYILKTVREPLILTAGGAELKSYAAALQAVVLMGYVPLYGWVASTLPRQKLILAVILFFVGCLQVFFLATQAGVPHIGLVFFVWVGIFSLTMVAQFWSYANDLYTRESGDRLFALIAIGSTAGAPLGALLAERMFEAGVGAYTMMQMAAGLLILHLVLYGAATRHLAGSCKEAATGEALKRGDGFGLVFRSRYLLLIAGFLVLLNVVNTTGEYLLGETVVQHASSQAAADPAFDEAGYIGRFYGGFFFWVNIATILIQAFLVSRIVKYLGMAGALFALPIVSLGTYGLVAAGAGFAILRWTKTAENSTDYSVMNTVKQMLWLPTSREEKYKAKQAIDTFFVRAGDLLSAGLVFVGIHVAGLGVAGFGRANVVIVLIWSYVGWLLLREYRKLTARPAADASSGEGG
jgi:AAA family ATP:ADP antiporter